MAHRGQAERFSGILTDLTASRALQERQRLAATVVDNTIGGVVVTDAQPCICPSTRRSRACWATEREVLGQNPRIFQSGRHDKGVLPGHVGRGAAQRPLAGRDLEQAQERRGLPRAHVAVGGA